MLVQRFLTSAHKKCDTDVNASERVEYVCGGDGAIGLTLEQV